MSNYQNGRRNLNNQYRSVDELWPSPWLKAEDLGSKTVRLTIKRVDIEELHNPRSNAKEPKAIVDFGRSKRLILNKTQASAISEIVGSDVFQEWAGYEVLLSAGRAHNGKQTIVIQAAPQQAPAPQPPAPQAPAPQADGAQEAEVAEVAQEEAPLNYGFVPEGVLAVEDMDGFVSMAWAYPVIKNAFGSKAGVIKFWETVIGGPYDQAKAGPAYRTLVSYGEALANGIDKQGALVIAEATFAEIVLALGQA